MPWSSRAWIAVCIGAVLALSAGPSYGQSCTPVFDHENDGAVLGCCDAGGNTMANGASCIMPGSVCKMGTCQSGTCQLSGINRANGTLCRNQNDPCQVGDCASGDCTAPWHLTFQCETDSNVCTDDCRPDTSTTNDLYDVTCGPFPIPGTCSVLNGSQCRPGNCNTTTGQCDPDMSKPTVECTTANDCKIPTCTGINSNGNPICANMNREQGAPCDTNIADDPNACDPNDPDYATTPRYLCSSDCKRKACDGEGQCRTLKAEFDGWSCEQSGGVCTKGVCDDGACNNEFNLPNESPCSTDGNDCTRDVCFTGVCDHSTQASGMENQPCTNSSGCQLGANGAVCHGLTCDIQTCDTTKVCFNCASLPCSSNAANECNCQ